MGRLNQPAKPGYSYRSPGQTNSRDLTPNLEEDVIASQSADAERIRRGLATNESPAQTQARRNSPHGNISQRDAAGRAILRSAGRAGLTGAALEAGYGAGRYMDEKTGAGKKLVEETGLGKAVERVAKPKDKVELSEYAKRRIAEEDTDRIGREVDADIAEKKAYSGKDQEERYRGDGYKSGGKVSASKRGDGIAQKGKTRGRMI